MRRSREQLERDRDALVAALTESTEAGEELRLDVLVCRANGLPDPSWHNRDSWWPYAARAATDLRALAKAGRVVCTNGDASYAGGCTWSRWKVATPEDLDAAEDELEVKRMQAHWEPAS